MKIKFNLIKLRNTLIFQIIEQDLMWNNVTRIDIPNGISIRRDNTYPYVEHFKSHNTLYLRDIEMVELDMMMINIELVLYYLRIIN